MYGDPGYRRRYGARAVYYNRYGYAGPTSVGGRAGPVTVGGGYGSPVNASSGTLAGYGVWPFTPKAGIDEAKKGGKVLNTLLDVGAVLGATIVAGPVGAVAAVAVVSGRKAAATKRETAEQWHDEAMGVGRRQARAQIAVADAIGIGTVGTAAQPGQVTPGTIGAGPVLEYIPVPGAPGVAVEATPGVPAWAWGVGGVMVASGIAFALTRGNRRR